MSNFEDKLVEEALKESKDKDTSFLIGAPVPWDEITEEDNKKEWIWENYIAKGHITLLSALWKAGKSTLLRCLFLAMAEQEEFAGQPTFKSKILVVSEEAKGDWYEKKEELDPEQIHPIIIWSRPIRIKPNLKQWTQLCEMVAQKCIDEKIDLVVIDTLTTFWPIDNENDSAQVIKALVPLYNFTENNIGVLLIHHFRKGGGDQAQASRGSGALPGFVDNIIEFTRSNEGDSYQRVLKTYGRFDGVIPEVVIKLMPDGKYKTLGEPAQVSKKARIEKLIDIFASSREPLSVKEAFNIWNASGTEISMRSLQTYVKDLCELNILSSVKSCVIGKKITQFYALTGSFMEQTKMDLSPTIVPFVSSVNDGTSENGSKTTFVSNPQFEAVTKETKGTSAIGGKPYDDN